MPNNRCANCDLESEIIKELKDIYDESVRKHGVPEVADNKLWVPVKLFLKAMKNFEEPIAEPNLDDFDYELASTSINKGGKTLCGKTGRNHRMKHFGSMVTKCIYPGCDAIC